MRRLESFSFASNTSKLTESERRELMATFHMMDRNGNGFIDHSDLQVVLRAFLQADPTEEQIRQVFALLDHRNAGRVGVAEFLSTFEAWISADRDAQRHSNVSPRRTPQEERRQIHQRIKAFFSQIRPESVLESIQANVQAEQADRSLPVEDEIAGTLSLPLTPQQRLEVLLVTKDLLRKSDAILRALFSGDLPSQLEGLKGLNQMLSVLDAFRSPLERRFVAETLIVLFEFIHRNSIVPRVVSILKLHNQADSLCWQAMKFFTYLAPGPKIAATPQDSVLHPGQMFFKKILFAESAVGLIVSCITSTNVAEVREQALIALGTIAADSPKCRDHLLQQGVLEAIVPSIQRSNKESTLRTFAWCLVTLCSRSSSEDPGPPSDRVVPYLPQIATLLFNNDPIVIRHTCDALFNLLPGFADANVCARLVALTSGDWNQLPAVQSAALKTISNIVRYDEMQLRFFLNAGLVRNLHALLVSPDNDIRVVACDALILVAGFKGEIQPLIQENILPTLLKLLATDDFARWKVVKVIKYMAQGTPSQVAYLVNGGVIKELCNCLLNFKEYDEVLTDVYKYFGPSFNFELVKDALITLQSIVLVSDMVAEETKSTRSEFTLKFDFSSMEKIKELLRAIQENSTDLTSWRHASDGLQGGTVEDIVRSLLFRVKRAFDLVPSDLSLRMSKLIADIWQTFFAEKLKTEEQEATSVVFKCLLEGDVAGRLIELPKSKVTYKALADGVEEKYQQKLLITYQDEEGDLITIDDQQSLQKALQRAEKTGANKLGVKLHLVPLKRTDKDGGRSEEGQQTSTAKKATTGQEDDSEGKKRRRLSDGTPAAAATAEATEKTSDEVSTNNDLPFSAIPAVSPGTSFEQDLQRVKQEEKTVLLKQLERTTHFGHDELASLLAFWEEKQSADGTISKEVFVEGLKERGITDPVIIEQNISAFDPLKEGKIRFRDFITGLSVTQRGTLDERLRFVFDMYDRDHNGKLSREEVLAIFSASLTSKGERLREEQLNELVNRGFAEAGKDVDRQLSFAEFKTAVSSQRSVLSCFSPSPLLSLKRKEPTSDTESMRPPSLPKK